MASTFFLAPAPKWYFFDAEGKLAAHGTMETFSSLDHITPKAVFSDPAGVGAYINPILLDGTGGTPVPMYWEDNGVDKYFVVIKDASGRIIVTIDNYPIVTSGTGPPITVNADVENFIINGNFHLISNDIFGGLISTGTPLTIPELPVAPPQGFTRVAQGGGSIGLEADGYYTSGSVVNNNGILTGPTEKVTSGWLFEKTGAIGISDTISFVDTLPGDVLPAGPSQNAPRFFQYEAISTAASTSLDLEYIIPDVRTFSGQTIHINFDAFGSGASGLTEFIVDQNFGTGGAPSATIPTPKNFTFPNGSWSRLSIPSISIPSITGKSIGTNRNSSLRLRWRFPLNTTGRWGLTNLQLQTGTPPSTDFIYQNFNQTANKTIMEMISGHLPQTGDMKWSTVPSGAAPVGWIIFADPSNTIGNVASAATFQGEDVRNLYRLWWNYPDSVFPVSSGRGGSADIDFDANKTMTLAPFAGEVFGVAAASSPVLNFAPIAGAFNGAQLHQLTVNQLAAHSHLYDATTGTGSAGGSDTPSVTTSVASAITGGNEAHNTMQPTRFWWLHIKL